MNGTLATGRQGLASGNVDIFHNTNFLSILELSITFGAASLLASLLKTRAHLLHGVFNVLLAVHYQGDSAPSKGSLLLIILGASVIRGLVQTWPGGTKMKDMNTGKVRLAHHEDATKKATHIYNESSFLQPMIFPSRTTHRRFFPAPHAFSYSYLLVGIPVSNAANIAPNQMLSTYPSAEPNHSSDTRRAWFSVNASDYLQRGRAFSNSNLRQKLDQYLETEGIKPDLYPYAYLVTAPCFLGFSFNPVSFWYLYDKSRTLVAMILEVNNTFDERRMYLLQRTLQPSGENEIADLKGPDASKSGKPVRFTQAWTKDFHVSPFNDRDGSYSVTVGDVAATKRILDNTIVLRSEDDKAKLVARIFSTEPGIDPEAMSLLTRIVFILQWFWVGFMTNSRILKEARVLWVKKLQVFYRPEPLRSSIGRNETPEETVVEAHFRHRVHALARRAGVTVEYWPAAGSRRGHSVALGHDVEITTPKTATVVKLHILTPEFYSELSREQGTLASVFKRICFQNSSRGSSSSSNSKSDTQHLSSTDNPLVWTDDEAVIRKLFDSDGRDDMCLQHFLSRRNESSLAVYESGGRLSPLEYVVAVLRKQKWKLRRILLWIVVRSLGFQCADQEFRLSEMDEEVKDMGKEMYVNDTPCKEEYRDYLWSVLQILLIDRLAFGFRGLFRLQLCMARFVVVVLAVQLVRLAFRMALREWRALA